jgi:hypothetical protein
LLGSLVCHIPRAIVNSLQARFLAKDLRNQEKRDTGRSSVKVKRANWFWRAGHKYKMLIPGVGQPFRN